MNMSNVVVKQGLKVLEGQKMNHSYMVDAQGKEIQITTAMVTTVCQQLLKQCRNIKN